MMYILHTYVLEMEYNFKKEYIYTPHNTLFERLGWFPISLAYNVQPSTSMLIIMSHSVTSVIWVNKCWLVHFQIQWNLRIMDTLGPSILSFIERLSSLQRLKMYYYNRKVNFGTLKCVLYKEVFSIVSFIGSVLYRRFHCTISTSVCSNAQSVDGWTTFCV